MYKKKELSAVGTLAARQTELALWEEIDERTGDLWDEQVEQCEVLGSLLSQQIVTVDRINAVVNLLTVTSMDVDELMERVEALELQLVRERSAKRIH